MSQHYHKLLHNVGKIISLTHIFSSIHSVVHKYLYYMISLENIVWFLLATILLVVMRYFNLLKEKRDIINITRCLMEPKDKFTSRSQQ